MEYVISLDHFLDERGAIAIDPGPARAIADFATAAVAYASNYHWTSSALRPTCFKCRQPDHDNLNINITTDDLVIWHCHTCGCQGQIANWRGTFWDLSRLR